MSETYRPKPLKPVTDPRELRDATVRDYRRNAERMGVSLSAADVERLAVADLQIVEWYQAGIDASPKAPPKPRSPRAPSLVTEPGAPVLQRGERRRDRPDIQYARAWRRGEKWAHAMGRLSRILEGASKHSNIRVMASTANDPALALEYLRLFAAWLTRNRVSRHNPFQGAPGHILSERDAARKFESLIYDICDRSSRTMGPWWVPK
jgi:hypothetical protein